MTSVNTKLSYRKAQKMCTSICYSPSDHYFGRNLDYEIAYGQDEVEDNRYEYTMYSDCMNLDKGILYFTTYDNNRINAVDMHKADLDSKDLICYDLFKKQDIEYMN